MNFFQQAKYKFSILRWWTVAFFALVFTAFCLNIFFSSNGMSVFILFVGLALATFVSEDLTCIGAGVAASQGHISFLTATLACLLGIFVGDLLLFLAGRFLGRAAVKRAPLKWFVSAEKVEQASVWFERKGMTAVFISRFVPGLRLPTYFAAGLLNTNFWTFTFYFFIAAAVWTPILVGFSYAFGAEIVKSTLLENKSVWFSSVIIVALIYFTVKLLMQLCSYEGRRKLIGRLRRITRWEFLPPYLFYPPVVCYIALLAIKYKSLTLFTSVNPAIYCSGFVGESKSEILKGLSTSEQSENLVARFKLIPSDLSYSTRIQLAQTFLAENGLSFPVVLKPDKGQRGEGVEIIKTEGELFNCLFRAKSATIIQEYIEGREFGVFYYRYPASNEGCIFSITDKRFPSVTGDGVTTLRRLILKDERAVCMADVYFKQHGERLWSIPASGERVALVELGTHCRGAVFFDGSEIKTGALEKAIDELSKSYEGFYFGRYDIKASSIDDFKEGKNFKVIELNGVTSEATNIYDPRNSLLTAYKILFEQWRIAFEIGAQNRALGVEPIGLHTLAKLIIDYFGNRPEMSQTVNTSCIKEDFQ